MRFREALPLIVMLAVVVAGLLIREALLGGDDSGTDVASVFSVPESVRVVDEGDETCGGGNTYQCGRTVLVELTSGSGALEDLLAALREGGFTMVTSGDDEWRGCSANRCVVLEAQDSGYFELRITEWRSD